MSRVSVTAKTFIVSLVGSLLLATPARADLITINFTGAVDLTSEGGAPYSYSGFFTWNTTASPHATEPGMAGYALANYNLIFNGVNVTIPVSPDGNGNDLIVVNDLDLFGTGMLDALVFVGAVGKVYDPTGDLILLGVLAGPTTMFNSTALPGNLDFLPQATSRFTAFLFEPDAPDEDEFFLDPHGTLVITSTQIDPAPVPEPASVLLLGTGLACAGVRRWRKSQ